MYIHEYSTRSKEFRTEEDVRAETNHFLRNACTLLGIKLRNSGHEVTSVFGGRADSIYSDVIIEYKSPNVDLCSDRGKSEVIDGRDDKDRGLRHYIVNFSLENSHNSQELFLDVLLSKIGIGFNGRTFILARYVLSDKRTILFFDGKTKSFPREININQPVELKIEVIDNLEIGMKKLLLSLRSTHRERLSSNSILEMFGPKSDLCHSAVSSIYKCLCNEIATNNLRVKTLYDEWNRIFGDVYGEKETDFTSIRSSLLSLYNIIDCTSTIDIRRIIFSIQTYFNIILKLVVYNLLNCLSNPTFFNKPLFKQADLLHLFNGKSLGEYSIQNFFEIQFFEWFIYAREFDLTVINDAFIKIDKIEATASIIKPEIVEDVFREVYIGLMPKEVRHLLGEYYTPGWLVEFVLDKAGYIGQPDLTLLDPACGSGSFVTHAIKRFISANKDSLPIDKIIEKITTQIVGYDINPITVITAKANYILSLGDITAIDKTINIPIYMCDSVLVPTVYAKQSQLSRSIKVNTIVGEFEIPVFDNRTDGDIFMKEVSSHVESYTFDEFKDYLTNNAVLSLNNVNLFVAKNFFEKICELHLSSQDSFWGIILKNAFAPLFACGGFDVVVGNPPWIAWKAMSDTYRKQTLDIWLSYGIFEKSAYEKITTHDDFAMAVTYVSIDHYCKENGELVFVLPQTFLKASKGGEGFRKFCITRDWLSIPFAVKEVYDMLKIRPFRGIANNKTSIIKFRKNEEMSYPMDAYFECLPNNNEIVRYNDSYSEAMSKFKIRKLQAYPINRNDRRSPWLTMLASDIKQQTKYLGQSAYRARKGIEPCGAKGIYLVNVTSARSGSVNISNIIERSRLPKAKDLGVHPGTIETTFVYPMIGGQNIDKWGIKSHLFMLVPHYAIGDSIYNGVPETDMKVRFPKTWEWLMYFYEILLETRERSGKFFDKTRNPFYRLDNVGPYTFQPYHVVWREQNKTMVACVISSMDLPENGRKIVVTDSKVLSCPFNNEYDAHYLCAIINSPIITKIIESYTIDTQRGVDILKYIAIPQFDCKNELHQSLANLSINAHNAYLSGTSTVTIEQQLDVYVDLLFS